MRGRDEVEWNRSMRRDRGQAVLAVALVVAVAACAGLGIARLGAVILPANPGFYNKPMQVAELVDFIVARVLDQLGVEHELMRRWGRDDAAR